MLSRLIAPVARDVGPLALSNRAITVAASIPGAGKAELDVVAHRAQIEELKGRFEHEVRQAYASGVRDGEAKCRNEAEGELRDIIARLLTSIDEVAATREEAIRRAEVDTLRLSLDIARRIVHRELALDESALKALITAALEKLRLQEVHRVRIHPGLERLVRSCVEEAGRSAELEVVSDSSQRPGGAVFEISRGSLDASLETQLREIERGFEDRLGDRP